MAGDPGYPTILIVYEDREFRDVLSRNLEQTGYLILKAENAEEAFKIVVSHSRRIHFLLADSNDGSRAMATTLKPYRPDMQVIHISSNLEFSLVLMEVSKVLESPPDLFEDNKPTRVKSVSAARGNQTARKEGGK